MQLTKLSESYFRQLKPISLEFVWDLQILHCFFSVLRNLNLSCLLACCNFCSRNPDLYRLRRCNIWYTIFFISCLVCLYRLVNTKNKTLDFGVRPIHFCHISVVLHFKSLQCICFAVCVSSSIWLHLYTNVVAYTCAVIGGNLEILGLLHNLRNHKWNPFEKCSDYYELRT